MHSVAYFPCFSCRWNEAFQKEVLSSRLETTDLLARAITKAPQPPQAWILVTGVGMPRITNPFYVSQGKRVHSEGVAQALLAIHAQRSSWALFHACFS